MEITQVYYDTDLEDGSIHHVKEIRAIHQHGYEDFITEYAFQPHGAYTLFETPDTLIGEECKLAFNRGPKMASHLIIETKQLCFDIHEAYGFRPYGSNDIFYFSC